MSPGDLILESRLLLPVLRQWSARLHEDAGVTGAMREVLELLRRLGPSPVPALAREYGVSRQHVQTQVDALLAADLVERRPNPAHKRSLRIALSDKGRALVDTLRAEERDAFAKLQTGVSDESLKDAIHVLAACRAALVTERS